MSVKENDRCNQGKGTSHEKEKQAEEAQQEGLTGAGSLMQDEPAQGIQSHVGASQHSIWSQATRIKLEGSNHLLSVKP